MPLAKPLIFYPACPPPKLRFKLMNLGVRLAPTGWKHYHNLILFRKQLKDSEPVAVPEPYEWKFAGPGEIEFMDAHPEATSPSAYTRRAARGDRCVCIKQGDELVGYEWITFHTCCALCGFSNMELTFLPLATGQAFGYDLYVYQKHRRHSIATLLRKLVPQKLRELGIKESFSLTSPENIPTLRLRAIMDMGDIPERMVYGYRIRNWQKTFLGPVGDRRLLQWWEQFKVASGAQRMDGP